jgi:hypothetical protein
LKKKGINSLFLRDKKGSFTNHLFFAFFVIPVYAPFLLAKFEPLSPPFIIITINKRKKKEKKNEEKKCKQNPKFLAVTKRPARMSQQRPGKPLGENTWAFFF